MGMRERIEDIIKTSLFDCDVKAREYADAILKVIEEELGEEINECSCSELKVGQTRCYFCGWNACLAALKEKLKEK